MIVICCLFVCTYSKFTENTLYLNLILPLRNAAASNYVINIAEIEAYDINDTKLELTVDSYSSVHSTYTVEKTIDGNYTNFGHTLSSQQTGQFFKYSISGISNICSLKSIKIYNRGDDCCGFRIVGTYLEVLDIYNNVFQVFNITVEQTSYQFNVSYCNNHNNNTIYTVTRSNNNILCSRYDEMSIYSGNWSFSKTDNDTCSLYQGSIGGSRIWFGSSDGGTYDASYESNAFIVESSLSVHSSTYNGGIIFRASSVASSFYYYGFYPDSNRIRVWKCCWDTMFELSKTFDFNTIYNLRIEAKGTYYNFSVDNEIIWQNYQLTDLTTGSIGLNAHKATVTFYSLNYTSLGMC